MRTHNVPRVCVCFSMRSSVSPREEHLSSGPQTTEHSAEWKRAEARR